MDLFMGHFGACADQALGRGHPVRSNFSIGDDSLLYLSSSLQVG